MQPQLTIDLVHLYQYPTDKSRAEVWQSIDRCLSNLLINLLVVGDFNTDLTQLANEPRLGTRTQLGAPGIATRSKDATRGSWPYY